MEVYYRKEALIMTRTALLLYLQNVRDADAAQYARLAANYSKANAYFSLANYLKK
jgi:hypothetical protein